MITFFRKIRATLLAEGKTAKYLKYAIGEILLVVIGILIAVQINNWNETRKVDLREISFLINMSDEIKSDIKYFIKNDSLYASYESDSEEAIDKLYQAKTINDIIIVDSLFNFKWRNLPVNRRTYDEMISTGSFYTLKNKILRNKISDYYHYVESQQYYIEKINDQSQERIRNPELNSFHFLLNPNSIAHSDYNQIDTGWIGNVNSPTYLALIQFYITTQGTVNRYRRSAYKGILDRSNELLNEIENELDNHK